jgi:FkbM family methyltransferase
MTRYLSYAQRLEDRHIALAFAGEPPGVYVDVGGGHPVADNVTFALYLEGWRGLVIEPQAALAAATRALRPRDVVVETLVGRAAGEAVFHAVERLHGFSTMVAEHATRARAGGAAVAEAAMPVTTLGALVAEHGIARIDVLKIDVEGAEAEVLAGHDWRVRPRLLVIEAVTPGEMAPAWDAFEPDLLARGYEMALFDGLNRFYVAAEAGDVRARLPREPHDWASVDHLWDCGQALAERGHPDHALAIALAKGLLARLPFLDGALLAALAEAGGARLPEGDDLTAALGRIAAGYDGGHLFE